MVPSITIIPAAAFGTLIPLFSFKSALHPDSVPISATITLRVAEFLGGQALAQAPDREAEVRG
jgi:trimethylamine:corrinoid methyltransferase-like protein